MRKALEAPGPPDRRQRRRSHGEVVVEHGQDGLKPGHGYDALKGEYGDLFKKGIVDAAKVTRSALQNAASIAAMVLTTETLITDMPEKEKAGAGGGHGHGGGHGLLVRSSATLEGPSRRREGPFDLRGALEYYREHLTASRGPATLHAAIRPSFGENS